MTEHEKTQSTHELTKKRKRLLTNMGAIFLILLIVYFLYWLLISRFYEETDDAYVAGNLVQVMSQISGRVTAIQADVTDLVVKGQPIISLDKADADVALKNAESQLALTARQVSQLYENAEELQAKVIEAKSNVEKTKEDLQRRQKLTVNKEISIEDLRHAKLSHDSALATLSLVQNQFDAAKALVSNSDLYHHPQLLAAEFNLRNAYLNWKRTTLFAPESGYVAKRTAQVGQQVDKNTVLMIIVPLNQVWIDANFKESQLKHIRIGQPAEIISDIYGSDARFHGTVVGLGAGTGSSFDLLPPQNATGNWIKIVQRVPVRIKLDEKELQEHPLRIGLSMTVIIDTHDRKGSVLTKTAATKIVYQTKDNITDLQQVDSIISQILQQNAKNLTCTVCEENKKQ